MGRLVYQRLRSDASRWRRIIPIVGGSSSSIEEEGNFKTSSQPQIYTKVVDINGDAIPGFLTVEWWKGKRHEIRVGLMKAFLPEGYPQSVHAHYLPFTTWNFFHMILSSAVGVLSTQSLLYGLGLSTTTTGSLAISSTLNWILKDGLGQMGGVAVVAYLGGVFDVEAKRYRFFGAFLLKAACLIELLVPMMPGYFLLTAALANVLKNVAWMATSATRAQIHRHLACKDNMGDLSAKTATQNTLASLLGTGLGVLLSSNFLPNSTSPPPIIYTVLYSLGLFAPLSFLSMVSVYKSCRYAVSPRMTLARIESLLSPLLAELFGKSTTPSPETLSQLKRYILDPDTLTRRETILSSRQKTISKLPGQTDLIPLLIEPPVEPFLTRIFTNDIRGNDKYWIVIDNNPPTVNIWFDEKADNSDIFCGILSVQLLRYFISRNAGITVEEANKLANELAKPLSLAITLRGWDLHNFSMGTRRQPLRIDDSV